MELAKLWVEIIGLVASFSAAIVALRAFLRGEQWKRAEFLAKEMKEFLDNPRVQKALLLIDWGSRRIALLDDSADDHGYVLVTRQLQVNALLPHTFLSPASMEESDAISSVTQRYTPSQAAIRDCYDAFLDGLERFSSYFETRLINIKQLHPYLRYWIDKIHEPVQNADDAAWKAALLTYVAFYEFPGVQSLFRAFDRSIDPSAPAFRGFLEKMKDQELARRLAAAAGSEYEGRRVRSLIQSAPART